MGRLVILFVAVLANLFVSVLDQRCVNPLVDLPVAALANSIRDLLMTFVWIGL